MNDLPIEFDTEPGLIFDLGDEGERPTI